MITLLIIIHILLCILLIISVLLQSGKGSDIASMLGGGMIGDALDSHGAMQTLAKFTTTVAILFFCSSIVLALVGLRQGKSGVLDELDKVNKKAESEEVLPITTEGEAEGTGITEEGLKVEGEKAIEEKTEAEKSSEKKTTEESVEEKQGAEGGIPELSTSEEGVQEPIQEKAQSEPVEEAEKEKSEEK
jgi:preprotein translocase subunit SecG